MFFSVHLYFQPKGKQIYTLLIKSPIAVTVHWHNLPHNVSNLEFTVRAWLILHEVCHFDVCFNPKDSKAFAPRNNLKPNCFLLFKKLMLLMVPKCKISTDENVEVVSLVKTWFTCHKTINYSYLILKWKTCFTLICHYSDRCSANSASISFAKTVRIGTKTWRNTCAMSAKSKGKLCLFNYKYHGKGKEN